MTKTFGSKRSLEDFRTVLTKWAQSWPNYSTVQMTWEVPQEHKVVKTESSHSECSCGHWAWDQSEMEEHLKEKPPRHESYELNFRDEAISIDLNLENTRVSGHIEQRENKPPKIVLNEPASAKEEIEKELKALRTFFKQFWPDEDIIIESTRSKKPKFPVTDISQIAQLIKPNKPTIPIPLPPIDREQQNSGPDDEKLDSDSLRPLPQDTKTDQKLRDLNLKYGAVSLYRFNDRIYAHGDFAHCPREDITHNIKVLRRILLDKQLTKYGKNYDDDLCTEERKKITPEEWEKIQREVKHIYHTQLIDITDEPPPTSTEEQVGSNPLQDGSESKCQRNKFGDYWNCVVFGNCPPEISEKCKAKAGPQTEPTESFSEEASVEEVAEEPQIIQTTLSHYRG